MPPHAGDSRSRAGWCPPQPLHPLPRSGEVPLPTSRWAEATGTHAAAAGQVQEPNEWPPLKDTLPYSAKASAGWMCEPATGGGFYHLM